MSKTVKLTNTEKEAIKLAKTIRGGEVLGLIGELGSGKTTFTKALGKALGVKQTITSPTFIIMQQYQTKKLNKFGKPLWLIHLDLYRTKNFSEVASLGLDQIWNNDNTVIVIEWADKIINHLPSNSSILKFIRDV